MTLHSKNSLLITMMLTSVVLVSACGNNQKTEDSKLVAEKRNSEKFDNSNQEDDAQFLVNAAEMNLEEIRLGQLAQQNGQAAHVKDLGKMMEDAHTKMLGDLTILAKSKRVTIPTTSTNDAQEAYRELNEESGTEFDKAYSDKMVDAHEDAIKKFESASDKSNDPEIKNWATAALPDLRAHLSHSIESQRKCDKM